MENELPGPAQRRAWHLARGWAHVALLALPLLTLVFALTGIAGAPAAHADGTVSFDHRNYTVHIQRNGDINILEHWQVHFSGGQFHHAHLAVYLARTSGIEFGTVSGAAAGSQQVTQTTDTNGNPEMDVAWDFPSAQDASRSFDIPYTVHGALGIGASADWLDWHFLADNTSFQVAASTVTIMLPQSAKSDEVQLHSAYPGRSLSQETVSGTTLRVTGKSLDSSEPLEVEAVFPASELDAGAQRPAWQVGDTPPSLPTALGVVGSQTDGQASYPQGSYVPPGDSTANPGLFGLGASFGSICGGIVCLIPLAFILLLVFGLTRGGGSAPLGAGYRRRWYGGWWGGGPWWGGPWNNRGPWDGGGGFGGGGFGGGGGMGGGGGGAGGGGGGGGAGFS